MSECWSHTEPLYHSFMYLLVTHFFPVSIQYLQCIHCNPSQDSSIGSTLARYRRGPRFKSRQGREFFSENNYLSFTSCKSWNYSIYKYFFSLNIKRSRLVNNSKTGHFCPDFEWFSLDRFIYKEKIIYIENGQG